MRRQACVPLRVTYVCIRSPRGAAPSLPCARSLAERAGTAAGRFQPGSRSSRHASSGLRSASGHVCLYTLPSRSRTFLALRAIACRKSRNCRGAVSARFALIAPCFVRLALPQMRGRSVKMRLCRTQYVFPVLFPVRGAGSRNKFIIKKGNNLIRRFSYYGKSNRH